MLGVLGLSRLGHVLTLKGGADIFRQMERITPKALKRAAALLGFDWADEEIDRLLPLAERSLELVDRLDSLPLRDVEPAVEYRFPRGPAWEVAPPTPPTSGVVA